MVGSNLNLRTADAADLHDKASAAAKDGLRAFPERIEHIQRYIRLHRPGKAAAVNTHSPSAAEQIFTKSNRQCDLHMLRIAVNGHILEILERGMTGSPYFLQILREIAVLQLPHRIGHTGVICKVVHGTQHCPVAALLPEPGECRIEIKLWHL